SVPDDVATALEDQPQAKRFFEGLSYSSKLRLVLAIQAAKTDDTRQRRIAKTVSGLAEGRA
ncbi:MAG TPA: YdeI/OmpD-associated family protein, partial [Chloroflexota bacterium]|nr:YdeI/OmpD-associated family protein [Chloroflexota bacterium]